MVVSLLRERRVRSSSEIIATGSVAGLEMSMNMFSHELVVGYRKSISVLLLFAFEFDFDVVCLDGINEKKVLD